MSKKTVEAVVLSGNNYFIQVKGNQQTLYNQIKKEFNKQITLCNSAVKKETNKGREEIRVCYTVALQNPAWPSLKTAVLIQTLVKEKVTNNTGNNVQLKETLGYNYFISNQEQSPSYYLDLKRKHWAVEAYHYIKDITYKEDSSKIK